MTRLTFFRINNAMIFSILISNLIGVGITQYLTQRSAFPYLPDIVRLGAQIDKWFLPASLLVSIERVNQARGEATKFNAIFKEYQKAPEVTQQRIYLETMNEVLSKVGKKIITDKETTGILPLFQIEKGEKEGKKND